MSVRRVFVALYVLAMVVVIVGVDILFLRDRFWPRLTVSIAIVVAFATIYLLLRKS